MANENEKKFPALQEQASILLMGLMLFARELGISPATIVRLGEALSHADDAAPSKFLFLWLGDTEKTIRFYAALINRRIEDVYPGFIDGRSAELYLESLDFKISHNYPRKAGVYGIAGYGLHKFSEYRTPPPCLLGGIGLRRVVQSTVENYWHCFWTIARRRSGGSVFPR
jgi:hypothetical protein